MNTRCLLLMGLLMALLPAAPVAADTPAVAVVRQYLAARTSGNYLKIDQSLTADSKRVIQGGNNELAAGRSASELFDVAEDKSLNAFVNLFFVNPKNASGYRFQIIGSAPGDASTVLVRVLSSEAVSQNPILLKIVTTQAAAVRVDIIASIALSAPKAFAIMREKGQRVSSQSNMKQISLGIIQYVQDNDNRYPDAAKWVDEVMPYVTDTAIFHDPSAPAGEKWSYAFNGNLSHLAAAKIDNPATIVMLFESNKGMKNASDTGQSVPRPGRHSGGTDYATADGHVQWFADGTKLSFLLSGK